MLYSVPLKMMALVLAVVMALAMCASAWAGESTESTPTYSISVDTTNDAVTHTYKVYQIFTGTPSADQLVDLKYGSSYDSKTAGASVPKSEIDAIGSTSDSLRTWIVNTFGEGAVSLGTEIATLTGENSSYTAAVPGYYLVLDTAYTATDGTADAYSAFMVQVVNENATFSPKKAVPSVDKQVKDDTNDAEAGATDGWGETADHEIGETFQFKLTATIPAGDYSAYKTYKVVFNDSMSAGITFESIESVKIGGTDATDYTLAGVQAGDKGEKNWTITFNNVSAVAGKTLESDLTIEVIYKAHLNTDAYVNTATGTTTNKNTVSLTYSNNPDATGTGDTDTTPEDCVWVFTYASNNTKVDANNVPVAGAGFTLKDSNGAAISLWKVGTTYYKYDSSKTDYPEGGTVVNEMITTADDGKFDIKGLDVGTYTLVETTVPVGYVKCEDVAVTIAATHAETSGTANVTLNSVNQSNTVVNLTGSTLPETGGMGTTIIYIVGAILVLGAGVVLITRKRMNSAK